MYITKNKKYNLYLSIMTYFIGFIMVWAYSHFMVAVGVLFMIAGCEYEKRFKKMSKADKSENTQEENTQCKKS